MSYCSQVREFHEVFGMAVSDHPVDLHDPDLEPLIKLRSNLHYEEYYELALAMRERNIVEIADAICDLIYVLCGTAVSFGIPLDSCFDAVHAANMSKLGPDGKPIRRADGKILKGPNFTPPNLQEVIYASA